MSERIEKMLSDMRREFNHKLDGIDLTLRTKQIEDAGRFAGVEARLAEAEKDADALGAKIRSHTKEHLKWTLYPAGFLAAIAKLIGLGQTQ